MKEVGFGRRKAYRVRAKICRFRKVREYVDEWERHRIQVPLSDWQRSDIAPAGPVGDEFDLVASSGKFLGAICAYEVDKAKTGDQLFEVLPQLLARMGEADGKVDIEGAEGVAYPVEFLVDGHDPAANEQGSLKEAAVAQGFKQAVDWWRE